MILNDYNNLIKKLDLFIYKFHVKNLANGFLKFLSLLTFILTLIAIISFFSELKSIEKKLLFYFLLIMVFIALIYLIFLPVLRLLKIYKPITHLEAAKIISNSITNLKDKIINILELNSLLRENRYSIQLVRASINQKISEVITYDYTDALKVINLSKSIKFLVISLTFFLGIFLINPSIIRNGLKQIIFYNTDFSTDYIEFKILNDSLIVKQGSDFEIKLQVVAHLQPKDVWLIIGNSKFIMERIDKNIYKYNLTNVINDLKFSFKANKISSKQYLLKVIYPPILVEVKSEIYPPSYTQIAPYTTEGTGDLLVPAGSIIKFNFKFFNTNDVTFYLFDTLEINNNFIKKINENNYQLQYKFLKNEKLTIKMVNEKDKLINKSFFYVSIIPDNYPLIEVKRYLDSININNHYFNGYIKDDYGFTKLNFVMIKKDSIIKLNLPLLPNLKEQEFNFSYLFTQEKEELEYYFEVYDNDIIFGPKKTQSQKFYFKPLKREEIKEIYDKYTQDIKSELNHSENILNKLENELRNLRKDYFLNKTFNWEQIQKLTNIIDKYKQIEENLKKIQTDFKNRNDFLKNLSEADLEILEKQLQLQKIMENIIDEEIKQMIEKLNEMMQKLDKEKIQEYTKDLLLKTEDISKELDRTIELFKKLEIEEKTRKIIKELEKLSDKQENLSEALESKSLPIDSIKKLQENEKLHFENLMNDYKNILKENQTLEYPFYMNNFEPEKENIINEFEKSLENLRQKNKRDALKNFQKNKQQLKDLSEKMENMLNEAIEEQEGEDERTLNLLLNNLLELSFNQEKLIHETKKLKRDDPNFNNVLEGQNFIKHNLRIIEDSLNALGKRNLFMDKTIKKHLKDLKKGIDNSIKNLESKNFSSAAIQQQSAMTSANELALLLNQIINQMNDVSDEKMCGKKSCKKKSKKNAKSSVGYEQMKNIQNQLKKQLQSLLEELSKNNNINEKKLKQEIAKMISIQDKFMEILNKMLLNEGISYESLKKLKEIKSLVEEIKKDLANQNITKSLLQRQEQILVKLLEAEKSENERETEEKRESKTANENHHGNFFENFKYKIKKIKYQDDFIEYENLPINIFYNEIYKKYLINLMDEK